MMKMTSMMTMMIGIKNVQKCFCFFCIRVRFFRVAFHFLLIRELPFTKFYVLFYGVVDY